MSHQNILITGGSGFIGSNFIRSLLDRPNPPTTVLNLDKLTYAGNPQNLEDLSSHPAYIFVKGDIADTELVGNLLLQYKIDAIVNFAAESHVDRSIDSPEPFLETNVLGTLRLLQSARMYHKSLEMERAQIFRFLHVSTDEVYGSLDIADPAFAETTPYAPNSPYASTKASSDHLVRAYQHTYHLPTLTTNCSNNYGPYQFPEKLMPLMILNALEGKDLPIYGDGKNIRDWLYVEDHCRAISTVLENGKTGETYNIGGKCEKTNIEIVDSICSILDKLRPREDGQSYKSQKTFVTDRPGHDRRYAINSNKIEKELGWTPRETFETGLEKSIQWYLENREWCTQIAEKTYQRERLGLN